MPTGNALPVTLSLTAGDNVRLRRRAKRNVLNDPVLGGFEVIFGDPPEGARVLISSAKVAQGKPQGMSPMDSFLNGRAEKVAKG